MGNEKIYDKGNSLLEIRGKKNNYHQVIQRIRPLFAEIKDLKENDPLREALGDLFIDPDSTQSNPKFFLQDHVLEEMNRLQDNELKRYLRYRYKYDIYPIYPFPEPYRILKRNSPLNHKNLQKL